MERILVAGNNSADREVRALIIEFGGYNCATTGSLEEAVNLLRKGFFALVVTDLKLGGNSPDHIVRCLKGVSPEVIVIALAASGETAEAANEVLPIPCSAEDLAPRIAQTLAKFARARAKSAREKRRFPRYAVNLPCLVKALRAPQGPEGLEIHTMTKNISRGGLYFAAAVDWKVGIPVECVMQLPSQAFGDQPKKIRSQGKIVRTVPEEGGIGIGASIERFEFYRCIGVKE